MYISKYIVVQDYNGEKLLFSTLTTAIVSLENNIYDSIFEKQDFSNIELVSQLKEMGFIHEDSFDELKELEQIRMAAYSQNNNKTLYYMITPTMACNARCYYCFEKNTHHRTMSVETAKKVAEYIVSNRVDDEILIQWFGGEPLLATHIIDLICSKLNVENIKYTSKITTNGYLLDDDVMRRAIEAWKTNTIQVTIDGLEEEYNKVKNYIYDTSESPFEKVINNIKNALSYDVFIRIRVNVDLKNIHKAKEVIAFLKETFGEYTNCGVYFAPINGEENTVPAISDEFFGSKEHPLISMLNFEQGYANLGQSRLFVLDKPSTWDEILLKYYIHPVPVSCFGSCKCSLSIDSKGDFYICHRYFGKGGKYSSGNVSTGLIQNEIACKYRDYRIPPKCEQCNLLPICQGGCRYNRDVYGESQACVPSKGAIKQLILKAIEEMQALQ